MPLYWILWSVGAGLWVMSSAGSTFPSSPAHPSHVSFQCLFLSWDYSLCFSGPDLGMAEQTCLRLPGPPSLQITLVSSDHPRLTLNHPLILCCFFTACLFHSNGTSWSPSPQYQGQCLVHASPRCHFVEQWTPWLLTNLDSFLFPWIYSRTN